MEELMGVLGKLFIAGLVFGAIAGAFFLFVCGSLW